MVSKKSKLGMRMSRSFIGMGVAVAAGLLSASNAHAVLFYDAVNTINQGGNGTALGPL